MRFEDAHLHGELVRQPDVVGVEERDVVPARVPDAEVPRDAHAEVRVARMLDDAHAVGMALGGAARDRLEPSVDPSSTSTSSQLRHVCANTLAIASSMKRAAVVEDHDRRDERPRGASADPSDGARAGDAAEPIRDPVVSEEPRGRPLLAHAPAVEDDDRVCALEHVEPMWLTTTTVRSRPTSASVRRMSAADMPSTALVASSRTSTSGSRTSARASAMRWRCPPGEPDAVVPEARRVAVGQRADEGVRVGAPRGIADRDLVDGAIGPVRDVLGDRRVEEREVLPDHGDARARPRGRSRRSVRVDLAITPAVGRTSRRRSFTIVDLPAPDGPTIAVTAPAPTSNVAPESAVRPSS